MKSILQTEKECFICGRTEPLHEVWKDVKGYEGWFQISNLGRVKGLREWNGNRYISQYRRNEHILTPTDNGYGYLIVSLKKQGEHRKNHYVHRLVADAFIDNPDGKGYVNHLDYNTKNNRSENLEWVTSHENVLHSVERMKHPKNVMKSKTGEKYIYYRKAHDNYRIVINRKEYRPCRTLAEAIIQRDQILKGVIQ